ncbi:MAG: rRNA pseudouridine synthase [Alphaproteobacteria bacterium]|nr:rRNA pseudouridine synthase [Alphaproteobacteria bacterium]
MAKTYTYKGNAPVRLNKWMAELGLCSRREAEALIAAGGVQVEGEPVSQPGHKIEPGQTLSLTVAAREAISGKFTAVLNKPVDYVSAQPEEGQVPAVRLLTKGRAVDDSAAPGRDASLAPLGRLDMDSRGLLLLSDDGVLAKAIIGPEHALEKEYLVTVTGELKPGRLTLLRNGLSLDGRKLKAARVSVVEGQTLRFILREGRKRQIRRMCDLVGLKVVDLQRIRIGSLGLGDLPEGQWRRLTETERAFLITASLGEWPKRLRDDQGKPIRKGRSFVGRGGPEPNREARPDRKDAPRGQNKDRKGAGPRRGPGKPGGGRPRD